MEVTEHQIIENCGKKVDIVIENCYYHLNMNLVVFHVDKFNKTKKELPKIQRKRINFINRLKYAEHKIFCI